MQNEFGHNIIYMYSHKITLLEMTKINKNNELILKFVSDHLISIQHIFKDRNSQVMVVS